MGGIEKKNPVSHKITRDFAIFLCIGRFAGAGAESG
jgi:hypothetical protein